MAKLSLSTESLIDMGVAVSSPAAENPSAAEAPPPSLGPAPVLRGSKLDRFEEQLKQLLGRYPRITAFEHLGGVATTCLYDNMKVVVTRWEDGQPVYNTKFLAFATHDGFRPIACRPRRPQTKD